MCARQIQTKHQSVYAGSRLKPTMCEKVLPYMPAFQPYRGKPAVRNDREGRGNVGIIRSPIRASTLPDGGGRAMKRTSLPLLRRREFIALLSDTAAWPRAARAQQPERMRRIGVLMNRGLHHRERHPGDHFSVCSASTSSAPE